MNYCLVIPHFNHAEALTTFLKRLDKIGKACIVVDDGSDIKNKQALITALQAYPDIHLVEHHINRGKGAAVWSGAHRARTLGYTHILQIDADGQHNPDDI